MTFVPPSIPVAPSPLEVVPGRIDPHRVVVNACCNPAYQLGQVMAAYRAIGFRHVEAWTTGINSALNVAGDCEAYRRTAQRFGMGYGLLRLPPILAPDDDGLARAVAAARLAASLGCPAVRISVATTPGFASVLRSFLQHIAPLNLTTVVENDIEGPLVGLSDIEDLLHAVDDPSLKVLMNVGAFHDQEVAWPEACDRLRSFLAMLRLSDQTASRQVPLGTGEIDLPALLDHLHHIRFSGQLLLDMQVVDSENTLHHLAGALRYLRQHASAQLAELLN